MGVYNSEKTLRECVDSVVAQTYDNWEFIICDDGSADHSYSIAKEYAKKDKRIKPISNGSNKKLPYTLNHCIKNASGKYLVRHDADDIMISNRLEKQVEFMENHPEYAVVGSTMYLFDEEDIWGVRPIAELPNKMTFLKGSPFYHPTVIMRTDIIKSLGGYSESGLALQRLEDAELWYRLFANQYKGYNIQEPLLKFREDRQAYTRRKLSHRIPSVMLQLQGFKKLSMPFWCYLFALKPILAGLTPVSLIRLYHRRRDSLQNRL